MQPLEAMEPPSPQAGVQPPAHSRRRTARFQRRSRPITALRCVGVGGCLCRAPQGRPCVCANDGDGGKCLTFTCIASWVRTLKVACKAGRASAPTTATSERRERQASERGFPPPFASLGRGGRGGRGACLAWLTMAAAPGCSKRKLKRSSKSSASITAASSSLPHTPHTHPHPPHSIPSPAHPTPYSAPPTPSILSPARPYPYPYPSYALPTPSGRR